MIINNNELKQMVNVAMLGKNSVETVINVTEKEIIFLLGNSLIYKISKAQKLDIPAGEYAIGSSEFVKIVNSLLNENSNLNIKNQQLIITDSSGDIKTVLMYGTKINIPTMEKTIAEIDIKELIEILKETKTFVSKDSSRPAFMGVCLHYTHYDNKLSVAASDGYRIYLRNIDVKCNEKEDFELIIDCKTVEKLKKIKNNQTLCIKKGVLATTGEKYFLTTDNMIFLQAFLAEEFLDYKFLFDKAKTNYKASYNNDEIRALIKYFEKCNKLSDRAPFIESIIENYNHKISCKTELTDIEKNSKSKTDKRFKISYNGKYMLEILKLYNYSDEVEVQMEDGMHPIILTDNVRTTLLLPIRTDL